MLGKEVRIWDARMRSDNYYGLEGDWHYGYVTGIDKGNGKATVTSENAESTGEIDSLSTLIELVDGNGDYLYSGDIFNCDVELLKTAIIIDDQEMLDPKFTLTGKCVVNGGIICTLELKNNKGDVGWAKFPVRMDKLEGKVTIVGDFILTPEHLHAIHTTQ